MAIFVVFFHPQGGHVAPIKMKFVVEELSVHRIFRLSSQILSRSV